MALHVVVGPPAAGKSTWVAQRAQHGDIVIDYDRLAQALTVDAPDGHDHTPTVRAVCFAARQAAIDTALRHVDTVDVYVIHSTPSDHQLAKYQRLGAHLHVVDPGQDVVMERCRRLRPPAMLAVVTRWYQSRPPSTPVHSVVHSGLLDCRNRTSNATSRSW
jgi:hypothetical protein